MSDQGCTMIVFGGTGDLAHRKLAPAIYNLSVEDKLPPGFSMIGVGRKQKLSSQYREELAASVSKYSPATWDENKWAALSLKLHYFAGDMRYAENYPSFKTTVETYNLESGANGNYLYYMALAPRLFTPIAENLKHHGMTCSDSGWRRLMIEKPFGSDLLSARDLNAALSTVIDEKNIYRIDHYLGKEMLQNILVLRFANSIFEPLWNERFIDHVQISAVESEGIGDRGRYYDRAGAMRDMFQSHLLQMLALTAMEPPLKADPDTIRSEKLKLLNAVQLWPGEEEKSNLVFGQYHGFRHEEDVAEHSQTETFAALKLAINNPRWQGVPFYMRTGKKLENKLAKIVIQFKNPPSLYFGDPLGGLNRDQSNLLNVLTLKVQPREGVVFQFNIKKPATIEEIVPVEMDFCQPCAFMINTPEAYERLLADAMDGDSARFSSWKEIESSWALTDAIYNEHQRSRSKLDIYEPGSTGPAAAEKLLAGDGRHWWES